MLDEEQRFYLLLLTLLTVLPVALHAARTKITLGPFFGLAGIYSIMLWQFLQTGWWIHLFDSHFNAGLTLFIPPLLLGGLLTVAFDGLRMAKSYMFMVMLTSLASWLFSIFKEQLATYVPVPYLIVLSDKEQLAIITALLVGQIAGILIYSAWAKRLAFLIRIPMALTASIVAWLVAYSIINLGFSMGITNVQNELGSFLLSGIFATVAITSYAAIAAAQGAVMPTRDFRTLLSFWRTSEPSISDGNDEISNRDRVVSELRLLNRRVKTSARLMDLHVQYASYGILVTDSRGKIEIANQPAHKLLQADDLIGLGLSTAIGRVLEEKISLQQIISESGTKKWITHDASGASKWLDLAVTPLKDGDTKAITGYYFLLKDTTENIRSEQKKVATHRIQDLNQAGRVLSHDFSNILFGAEAQLLKIKSKQLDVEATEAAGALSQALWHARDMLRQLGTGSQFGTPRLMAEEVDELVAQAVDICNGSAKNTDVTIVFQRGEPCFVDADRSQIVRVFTNLLKNAIRASPPHGKISITVIPYGAGIEIVFEDEGAGMTAKELEMAFEPGFSSKGAGKGGLGLAISYLMIDAHGGHLDLSNNPSGRGIRAIVWLPASHALTDNDAFVGKNVIVAVEDPQDAVTITARLENELHCNVSEAHNKEEVIALIRESGPWDILLLDDRFNSEQIGNVIDENPGIRVFSLNEING